MRRGAWRQPCDGVQHLRGVVHRCLVDAHQHVAGMHAGLLGRAVAHHAGDDGAFLLRRQLQRLGQLGGQVLWLHADVAPDHPSLADDLVHDLLHDGDGDGKADAQRATAARIDGRVDAQQLAACIHQRAARVARVDGRVGLDEVLEGVDAQLRAAQRRDDAHRHRLAHAERVADGQHNVADGDVVAVRELDGGQVLPIHLQHGQVGVRITADQACLQPFATDQDDLDLRTVTQHVMVGEDVAVLRGDHARAHVVVGVLVLFLVAIGARRLAAAGRGRIAVAVIHRGSHAVVMSSDADHGRCGTAGGLGIGQGSHRHGQARESAGALTLARARAVPILAPQACGCTVCKRSGDLAAADALVWLRVTTLARHCTCAPACGRACAGVLACAIAAAACCAGCQALSLCAITRGAWGQGGAFRARRYQPVTDSLQGGTELRRVGARLPCQANARQPVRPEGADGEDGRHEHRHALSKQQPESLQHGVWPVLLCWGGIHKPMSSPCGSWERNEWRMCREQFPRGNC